MFRGLLLLLNTNMFNISFRTKYERFTGIKEIQTCNLHNSSHCRIHHQCITDRLQLFF
jgi:hypothetical protein